MCKVIIISNPTAVEVVLSCIGVVVGVLTKRNVQCTDVHVSNDLDFLLARFYLLRLCVMF